MMNEEDGSKGTGADAGSLQNERWNEMDWNHDGTIEFSEFIYTFSRWIDIDSDE
jgi:calcium-binding protein CML